MSSFASPVLSVLVVTHTGNALHESQVHENLCEILNQLASLNGELIVVSATKTALVPAGARLLVSPERGYYGQKTFAFENARGEFAVFLDGDCRPAPGYLQTLLEIFHEQSEVWAVAGPTSYDGRGFLTRLNTCLSFGYFFDPKLKQLIERPLLANNFAIRRSCAPHPLFGPWLGRVKGDEYLTRHFADQRHPVILDQRLRVFHADLSFELPDIIERHLREHLSRTRGALSLKPLSRSSWRILREVARCGRWRQQKLDSFGNFFDFQTSERLAARAVISLYTAIDFFAVTMLVAIPSLAQRWFRYQEHDHAAAHRS